jgi:hypothetical protein
MPPSKVGQCRTSVGGDLSRDLLSDHSALLVGRARCCTQPWIVGSNVVRSSVNSRLLDGLLAARMRLLEPEEGSVYGIMAPFNPQVLRSSKKSVADTRLLR